MLNTIRGRTGVGAQRPRLKFACPAFRLSSWTYSLSWAFPYCLVWSGTEFRPLNCLPDCLNVTRALLCPLSTLSVNKADRLLERVL